MKPNAYRLALATVAVFALRADAQEALDLEATCSYYGEPSTDQIWGFSSDDEAESAVERIMRYTGLPQNFEVVRGNVDNAMAAIKGDTRLIVYNQAFMEQVKQTTRTDWSSISILAHEIGHHLAGHTLKSDGSRPKAELEADKFSGHVLYKMGAQMEDAKAAMKAVASDSGSKTHPPKSARLVAIETGWFDARDQDPQREARAQSQREPEQDDRRAARAEPDPAPVERQPLRRQQPEPMPFPDQQDALPDAGIVAECEFIDGGIAHVMQDGTIVMNYMGVNYPVGRRQPSNDPRFAWFYVAGGADAVTEQLMNMYGMSSTTTYGVDHNGVIWGANMYGQAVPIGEVTYY